MFLPPAVNKVYCAENYVLLSQRVYRLLLEAISNRMFHCQDNQKLIDSSRTAIEVLNA